MPTINPDYNWRRRMTSAVLRSPLNVGNISELLGHIAIHEIDGFLMFTQSIRNFNIVEQADNTLNSLKGLLSNTQDIETPEQLVELLEQIQRFASIQKPQSSAFVKFLELHHAYLGISQATLDEFQHGRQWANEATGMGLLLLSLELNFHSTSAFLLSAILQGNGEGLNDALRSPEAMRSYLLAGTGVCPWSGQGPLAPMRQAYDSIEAAIVGVFSAELPRFATSADERVVRGLVEMVTRMLRGYIEDTIEIVVDRAILTPLNVKVTGPQPVGGVIGYGQRMLGQSMSLPLSNIFPPQNSGVTVVGSRPTSKVFSSVPELKKTLANYTGADYSDEFYAVVLKAFNESPAKAVQSLLDLDVTSRLLELTSKQLPKAFMHIFSKCPSSQLFTIPKTPEGSLQEQVEFVLYWTLLSSHLNGYPIPLKPAELEVVFKYIHSDHYRATLIYII